MIFQYLPEGPRYYDEDTVTDQTMREIAGELIREQALRKLKDEVPHGIAVLIDEMHQRKTGIWTSRRPSSASGMRIRASSSERAVRC